MSESGLTLQGEYIHLPQEHVIFGAGSLARLADEVKRLGRSRALVITGQSLATKTDVIEKVAQALGSYHAGTFPGIHQHTPKGDVVQALEMLKSLKADIVVSVGGGSPIDATKAVVAKFLKESGQLTPHIAIPTTLSAAEFSHLVGVTDEETRAKGGFADLKVTPTSVVLDPALTLPTPLTLWLSTGIRALDHAVETLYAPGAHPVNDVLALEAIRLLFVYLPACKEESDNLEIRARLQLAAWMSFFGTPNTPVGLSHNLGRRIGASYNVPHGITSCITLAHVMREMAQTHPTALARMARTLELDVQGKSDYEAALAAANAVSELVARLGLPQRLSEVGISKAEIPKIAGAAGVAEGAAVSQAEKLLKRML